MNTLELNKLHIEAYTKIAPQFAKEAVCDSRIESYLVKMLAEVPNTGRLIDVGCGPGQYTHRMNKSRATLGVDLLPAFVDIARERYPGENFIQGDMYHLPSRSNMFDGMLAIAAWLHAPKAEMPRVLAEAKRVLKDKGGLVCLMKTPLDGYPTDGFETRSRSGAVVTRYFARYTEGELDHLLNSQGFEVREQRKIAFQRTPTEPWILTYAQVNKHVRTN